MTPFFIIQKDKRYLTYQGGFTPNLAKALQCTSREEAARHQAMLRARGTINRVEPQTCACCQTLFDPVMGHTCA